MLTELSISTANCLVQQDGHVLIVTLNRPEAKNAFSPEMLLGMYKAWRLLDEDDNLRCAILTANGDTFCAGMDLKAGADGQQRSTEEFMALMAEVPNIHWQALLRDNRPAKPLILAVEGYALAGGTEILQGTDIRVAAEDASFGVTEVARGLYPMSGSTVRLPDSLLSGRRDSVAGRTYQRPAGAGFWSDQSRGPQGSQPRGGPQNRRQNLRQCAPCGEGCDPIPAPARRAYVGGAGHVEIR